jgi:hypothetical protein
MQARSSRPCDAGSRQNECEEVFSLPDQAAAAVVARQELHLPSPGRRGSGLPSPVLKLAWQRRQTYILELDIIGRMPGSAEGRAAVYSAWDWRSFTAASAAAVEAGVELRRVVMVRRSRCDERFGGRSGTVPDALQNPYCPAFAKSTSGAQFSSADRAPAQVRNEAGRQGRPDEERRAVAQALPTAGRPRRGALQRRHPR